MLWCLCMDVAVACASSSGDGSWDAAPSATLNNMSSLLRTIVSAVHVPPAVAADDFAYSIAVHGLLQHRKYAAHQTMRPQTQTHDTSYWAVNILHHVCRRSNQCEVQEHGKVA